LRFGVERGHKFQGLECAAFPFGPTTPRPEGLSSESGVHAICMREADVGEGRRNGFTLERSREKWLNGQRRLPEMASS